VSDDGDVIVEGALVELAASVAVSAAAVEVPASAAVSAAASTAVSATL
jgi:hypothetical protein